MNFLDSTRGQRIALLMASFSLVWLYAAEPSTGGEKAADPPLRWSTVERPEEPILRAIPGTWQSDWFVVGSVAKVNDKIHLYYGSSHDGNRKSQLGLAVSEDGLHWRRYSDDPIWTSENWDLLLRDIRVYNFGEEGLWMYYSDYDQHIDLAFSKDGVNWRNYENNPVMKITQDWEFHVMQERILRREGKWRMWYSTYGGNKPRVTGLATSTDGLHWTKYTENPVFGLGQPGEWDDYSAFQPEIFWQDGYYHMLYTGSNKKIPEGYRIGYAWSKDGIHWTKSPDNPIFVPRSDGHWDGGKVSCPTLYRTAPDRGYLYYSGAPKPKATYIGIGLIEVRFTKP